MKSNIQRRRNFRPLSKSYERDLTLFSETYLYLHFREKLVPWLRSFPSVKIWLAAEPRRELLYSLAILLHEEQLPRWQIYVTDSSPLVLERTKTSSFPIESLKSFAEYYSLSGGKLPFKNFFSVKAKRIFLKEKILENISFFQHRLESDASPNEFQIIFCRKFMPKTNGETGARILKVLHDSLCHFGVLILGNQKWTKNEMVALEYREPEQSGLKLFKRNT